MTVKTLRDFLADKPDNWLVLKESVLGLNEDIHSVEVRVNTCSGLGISDFGSKNKEKLLSAIILS